MKLIEQAKRAFYEADNAMRLLADAVERLTAERDEARERYSQARHDEDEAVAVLTVTRKQCAARVRDLEAERDRLAATIEDYLLWRPGERGHAEAHRKLGAALAAVAPEAETKPAS